MTNQHPTSVNPVNPPAARRSRQQSGKLVVPEHPIMPFIDGDGTGRDIWRASVRVFDAAVKKAYGGKRKIEWMEVYAGEKAFKQFRAGCRMRPSRPSASI